MKRKLLYGNEAIAFGFYYFGGHTAFAYPGTPSTEILEAITGYFKDVYTEWAPNEKVALETGIGTALAGLRTIVCMKHVGLNVATDPLMTLSYIGVKAGLIIVSADDPAMHSSQNEQDNRNFAKLAKIPMIEPSDSQEAYDFIKKAWEISEKYDTPVLYRITTRLAHSQSIVEYKEDNYIQPRYSFKKNPKKYVMIPNNARIRHKEIEKRLYKMKLELSSKNELSTIINKELGFISSGTVYLYTKESFPNASHLKLDITYPLNTKEIKKFTEKVKEVYVVEELDPFLTENILFETGIRLKRIGSNIGELSPSQIKNEYAKLNDKKETKQNLDMPTIPDRPPVLCPGCPHRGIFYVLKKLNCTVSGDIGCYTLGALPPLSSMDTCVDMGSSVSLGNGIKIAQKITGNTDRVVSVIGDSTFVHSGITGLIDAVYNKIPAVIIILDNSTTAMTGRQEHPGTGKRIDHSDTTRLDYTKLAESIGVKRVSTIDPYNIEESIRVIKDAIESNEVNLIIAKRICALMIKDKDRAVRVDSEQCKSCKLCLNIGCPAIAYKDNKAIIIEELCTGCDICIQICPFNAIKKIE